LISNKPLEASTTVEQSSIEIENHGLNVRQHLLRGVRKLKDARHVNVPGVPQIDHFRPSKPSVVASGSPSKYRSSNC
jgi:hypothetical protein